MKKIISFTLKVILLGKNQLIAFENEEKIYLITSEEQKVYRENTILS